MNDYDIFQSKVDKNGPLPDQTKPYYQGLGNCWVWTGSKDVDGYGIFSQIDRTMHRAHRWIWKHSNGPIPPKMCVLHHCDNPSCVRLDHLWLGTMRDNIIDRDSKQRQAAGVRNGFYGKSHSDETIQAIRDKKVGVLVGSKNPFYGKTHTQATKDLIGTKVSEKLKDVPKSPEHKRKLGEANARRKGIPRTEQEKENMRIGRERARQKRESGK